MSDNRTGATPQGGRFYIIQVDPTAHPNRLKFGYSDDPWRRLREHRTAAPKAVLLDEWPSKRSWEPCIIDALTCSAVPVGGEVFDAGDVYAVWAKAQKLFDLLPDLDLKEETRHVTWKVPRSLHSALQRHLADLKRDRGVSQQDLVIEALSQYVRLPEGALALKRPAESGHPQFPKEEASQITLNVPISLLSAIRQRQADLKALGGTSQQALVIEALTEYLERTM